MCIRSFLLALRQKVPQTVYYSSVGVLILTAFSQDVCLGSKCVLLFILELIRSLFPKPSCCFLLPDALPPSQYADGHSSDLRTDSSRRFQLDASPSKPQTSHRPVDQTNHYLQDVQSDQLQRGMVLGPPGSPQGVKSASQAQKDDRLKKLEKRLEELARMLDMVKTQVRIALGISNLPCQNNVT